MPIWNDGDVSSSSRLPQNTMQRVRAGRALPILSNTAMFDLALFGHEPFLRYYAQNIAYPYPNLPDVSQLANYDRYANRSSDIECKEFYLSCLQNHIFRGARAAGVDPVALEEARAQADQLGVSVFANLLGLPPPRALLCAAATG